MPEALIPVVAKDNGCEFGGESCLNCKLDRCVLENKTTREIVKASKIGGGLSKKEEELLSLIAKEGLNTTEIEHRLKANRQTIKNQLFSARKKLGAKTIAHAVYLRYVVGVNTIYTEEKTQ